MVRTKADSVPSTYRKVVASRAPRKVLGSSNSATNSASLSSRKDHVLCNPMTQMMKTNRTSLFIFE
uniref:PCNA-associated factor n=1 Tax=Oryctolagus cuniculus TaxID=9986 RepID=A0A5F9CJL9_RABIT|nr:PCNA-associated factor isoform X2 [Oryctolagus cuniculus]